MSHVALSLSHVLSHVGLEGLLNQGVPHPSSQAEIGKLITDGIHTIMCHAYLREVSECSDQAEQIKEWSFKTKIVNQATNDNEYRQPESSIKILADPSEILPESREVIDATGDIRAQRFSTELSETSLYVSESRGDDSDVGSPELPLMSLGGSLRRIKERSQYNVDHNGGSCLARLDTAVHPLNKSYVVEGGTMEARLMCLHTQSLPDFHVCL